MRLLLLLSCFLAGAAMAAPERIAVPGGSFQPMFGSEGQELVVAPFQLDRTAVTAADFAKFVKNHRVWRRGVAAAELADPSYLAQWKNALLPKAADRNKPVIQVSWFAAVSYCEAKGGRLPSTLEWEYAAAASAENRDATKDPAFQEQILLWYSTRDVPTAMRKSEANFYGLEGLHGLIWEWTSDFNAFFITADNRQDGDQSKNFFCGGGSTSAADRTGYAAFMRYALRGSLSANFTLNSLGFRCAYDQ